MAKGTLTIGTDYVSCPSEKTYFQYEGEKEDFHLDREAALNIVDMLFNGEFKHYFMKIEFDEEEEED